MFTNVPFQQLITIKEDCIHTAIVGRIGGADEFTAGTSCLSWIDGYSLAIQFSVDRRLDVV